MLSMQDFPVDFAAVTTLKWGEGKRKAKMSENEKNSEIDTVSQLFLHGIVVVNVISETVSIKASFQQRSRSMFSFQFMSTLLHEILATR